MTALARIFGEEYVIHGAPIDVAPEDNPGNEPEPDVIVLWRCFETSMQVRNLPIWPW